MTHAQWNVMNASSLSNKRNQVLTMWHSNMSNTTVYTHTHTFQTRLTKVTFSHHLSLRDSNINKNLQTRHISAGRCYKKQTELKLDWVICSSAVLFGVIKAQFGSAWSDFTTHSWVTEENILNCKFKEATVCKSIWTNKKKHCFI